MEWFKMQAIWGAAVERLSDAEAGRFIKALFAYINRDEEYHGGGREEPTTFQALETLRADKEKLEKQRAIDEEKRRALSEKRRAAINKRWAKEANQHTSEYNCIEPDTNESICIQVNTNCMENKNKSKSKIVSPSEGEKDDGDSAGARGDCLALSDAEIAEALRQDEQIEAAARAWGLPCHEGQMILARNLARQYTLPWLLSAIETAGGGKAQTWDYVQGILRRYAQDGGPGAPKKGKGSAGKTVSAQAYTQRPYTEAEMDAMGTDLLAEARARHAAEG